MGPGPSLVLLHGESPRCAGRGIRFIRIECVANPRDLSSVRSLLDLPAPAVLATQRKNGTVKLAPVWFRHHGEHFEVVITDDDVKLKHIKRHSIVTLLIFEATPPFRGVQVMDEAEISRENLDETRQAITGRYLDQDSSKKFTERRRGNGAVVRSTRSILASR